MKKILLFSLILFFWSFCNGLFATDYDGPTAGYDPMASYNDYYATSALPLGVDPDGYSYAIDYSPVTGEAWAYFLSSLILASNKHNLWISQMGVNAKEVPTPPIIRQGNKYVVSEPKITQPDGSTISDTSYLHLPITYIDLLRAVRYVNWYNWYTAFKEEYKKNNPSYKEDDATEADKLLTQAQDFCKKNEVTERGTYIIHNEYMQDISGNLIKTKDTQWVYITPDTEGIKTAISNDQKERENNKGKPPLKMVFLIPKGMLSDFFNRSSQQTDPYKDNSLQNCFVPVKKDEIKQEPGEDFQSFQERKKTAELTYSSYLNEWTSSFVSATKPTGSDDPTNSKLYPSGKSTYQRYYQEGCLIGDHSKSISEQHVTPEWDAFIYQWKNVGFRLMEVTFPPDADSNKLPKPVSDTVDPRDPDNPIDYQISMPPPPPAPASTPNQSTPSGESSPPTTQQNKPDEQVNTSTP